MNRKIKYLSLTAALLLCILLTACAQSSVEYRNYPGGCSVGDTVYTEFGASLVAYNAELGGRFSLCRDPLCTHEQTAVCLNSLSAYSVVTDGERIFTFSRVMGDYGVNGVIYALSPKDGGVTILAEFGVTGGGIPSLYCDGEYVYYTEGFYRDGDLQKDSYGVLMRVKCGGGSPSVAVGGEWSNEAELYADETNYYVCDRDVFTVIDRKTGASSEYTSPFVQNDGVYLSGGAVYLLGASEMGTYKSENCEFFESNEALYRFSDGSFSLIADGMSYPVVFGEGGIYYTPRLPAAEYEHVGTKELPNGGGNSTYDFIRRSDGTVICVDLESGEKQAWTLDSEYIKVEMQACVGGSIFATVSDLRELSAEYKNCRLSLNGDGSVSIIET